MKFFSVFVIFFYVRTVYSYYTGSAVSTPQLEASRLPVNTQNAYPRKQANSDQLSPIQKEYRIGPGLPYPYQLTQAASGIHNNAPTNRAGISPYAAVVKKHVELNPHLKALYKTSIPKKSYTIVHPDGTIEHTDQIHLVTARYPNYLMVKATDILAHINQHSVNEIPTLPYENRNLSTKPTIQKIEETTNPYEAPKNNQLIDTNFAIPLSNPIANQSNTNIQEPAGNPADLNQSNVKGNIQDITKGATNIILSENIPKEGNSSSINKDLPNAVAANPLPIYPTTPLSNEQEENKKPVESPAARNNETLYPIVTQGVADAIATPVSKPTDTKNDIESAVVATNQTTPIRPTITVQVPAEVDEKQVLEVILPEILRKSASQEIQTGSSNEVTYPNEITPSITTIEEPIPSYKANDTVKSNNTSSNLVSVLEPNVILDVSQSKDTVNVNVPNDTSQILANTTNTSDVGKEFKTVPELPSNSTVPSVPNQSSTPFDNGLPATWFHLSDENILEAIRSNASNVFFFFLPPQPKRLKEIRTTIFPNGTTVEETFETDEDKDQDGQPKLTKNSTIVYKRS